MSDLHLCSCESCLDLWGRSLWGPLFHALWFPVWLRHFVWISPGLWFCDRSEIESKSSRFRCLSPRRLVASNLGRYKAIYPLFTAKLSLFLNLLSWRSDYPFVGSCRHLSNQVAHVIAKQVSGDDRLGEWQLAPTCVVHMLASDCNPDWSMNEIVKSQKKTSPSSGQRDACRSHHLLV